jgi:hypothetical protein
MDAAHVPFQEIHWGHRVPSGCAHAPECRGGLVEDLAYIGLTILVFGVLWLIVKGVERFER